MSPEDAHCRRHCPASRWGCHRQELPAHIVTPRQAKTALATLQEITAAAEKAQLARMVQLTKGNRSKAAEILGISRKTLREKFNANRLDFGRSLRNNDQYY